MQDALLFPKGKRDISTEEEAWADRSCRALAGLDGCLGNSRLDGL